jgi:hypothetical protein
VSNVSFSSSCSDIDNGRHRTQFPIQERSCIQQAIAEILISRRDLTQVLLVLDFRREERIGLDMSIRCVRAELRGCVAFDAGSKRGIKKSGLSFDGCWDVSKARHHRILASGGFIVVICYRCSRLRRH